MKGFLQLDVTGLSSTLRVKTSSETGPEDVDQAHEWCWAQQGSDNWHLHSIAPWMHSTHATSSTNSWDGKEFQKESQKEHVMLTSFVSWSEVLRIEPELQNTPCKLHSLSSALGFVNKKWCQQCQLINQQRPYFPHTFSVCLGFFLMNIPKISSCQVSGIHSPDASSPGLPHRRCSCSPCVPSRPPATCAPRSGSGSTCHRWSSRDSLHWHLKLGEIEGKHGENVGKTWGKPWKGDKNWDKMARWLEIAGVWLVPQFGSMRIELQHENCLWLFLMRCGSS